MCPWRTLNKFEIEIKIKYAYVLINVEIQIVSTTQIILIYVLSRNKIELCNHSEWIVLQSRKLALKNKIL